METVNSFERSDAEKAAFRRELRRVRNKRRDTARTWLQEAALEAEGDFTSATVGVFDSGFKQISFSQRCGLPQDEHQTVGVVERGDGMLSTDGVIYCCNKWTCPTCAPIMRWHESKTVEQVIDSHDGAVYFITVTLRHDFDDSLADLLKILGDAWRKVKDTTAWRTRVKPSYVGDVRALELTIKGDDSELEFTDPVAEDGRASWHPHFHMLLLLDKPFRDFESIESWLQQKWVDAVVSVGGKPPLASVGLQIVQVHNSSQGIKTYLSKVQENISVEMTRADLKSGRVKSISPFQLLDSTFPGCKQLFIEYFKATKGKRTLLFSKGLLGELGVAPARLQPKLGKKTRYERWLDGERRIERESFTAEEFERLADDATRESSLLDVLELGNQKRADTYIRQVKQQETERAA